MYIHKHIHIIYTHLHVHMDILDHLYTRTQVHTHKHTHTHTHTHTQVLMHTDTHTTTHYMIQGYSSPQQSLVERREPTLAEKDENFSRPTETLPFLLLWGIMQRTVHTYVQVMVYLYIQWNLYNADTLGTTKIS